MKPARRPSSRWRAPRGRSFAFLGYDTIAPFQAATADTPGVAPYDPETLADDVRRAGRLADHVVVAVNWGVEYTADPTTLQRELAHAAVEAGAALVVGNHPHWVQATEEVADGLAVYALGNFVFDQSWSEETTQSVILEASFAGDRLIGYRLRPVVLRGLPEGYRALYRPDGLWRDTLGSPSPALRGPSLIAMPVVIRAAGAEAAAGA